MANTIKIKSGSGTPTTSDIQDKELAFDRSADRLYINDAGTIVDLTGSGATGDIEGVTAGTGLSGGGTSGTVSLSTNDSEIVHDDLSGFVANEHIDHSSVTIYAGAGLTGGGTIAASRNIHVGAGTGIDVAADAISVDVSDFMTNGSNDRILTATGTDAMNAEANLTFSPSNNYLTVHEDGASIGSHLRLATDNSDFFLSASGSSNQLIIYDANAAANRLVVSSSGNFQILNQLSVNSSITTGYGVAFTNGNTNFLMYNNTGDNLIYLRRICCAIM